MRKPNATGSTHPFTVPSPVPPEKLRNALLAIALILEKKADRITLALNRQLNFRAIARMSQEAHDLRRQATVIRQAADELQPAAEKEHNKCNVQSATKNPASGTPPPTPEKSSGTDAAPQGTDSEHSN